MITRSARIPRSDFLTLSRSRHHIHGEYHTVVYTPLEVYRGAVVVSKKVAKSAVDRNRLRRRAYATIATLWQTSELPTGAYIIYYKSGALKVSRKDLAMSLATTLARIPKSR